MQKILIIQTAFIGDVVLTTALAEKLYARYPNAEIDFLVRMGNETLLGNHPAINRVLIWNKKENKIRSLVRITREIRAHKYELLINVQRFFSTGLITALSGAKETRGFKKNPLSFLFTKSYPHIIDRFNPVHETQRNQSLIADLTGTEAALPSMYPSVSDFQSIEQYCNEPFVTMTPSSVWFTKKYPFEKWTDLINRFSEDYNIYLLGGSGNKEENESLLKTCSNPRVKSLAGELSFLQSVALMKKAAMNYVNDSAPLHFCSAVNAPVTAIFCSTVPGFGFTPLSQRSFVVETSDELNCRPCGLHGKKACPEKHFKCGFNIATETLLAIVTKDAAGK